MLAGLLGLLALSDFLCLLAQITKLFGEFSVLQLLAGLRDFFLCGLLGTFGNFRKGFGSLLVA